MAKNQLTPAKVLAHYNPSLPLQLAADVSAYRIGVVISHAYPDGTERPIAYATERPIAYATERPIAYATERPIAYATERPIAYATERPIAYASRTLSSSEKNYAKLEKETLSLVLGNQKFHSFLYGHEFTLYTDHKPLTTIF